MAQIKQDMELEKALKRVKLADKFRIALIFIALLFVLFLFYGDKIVGEAGWYVSFKALTYEILFFLILLMLFSTIIKMTFVAKYNALVKKKK